MSKHRDSAVVLFAHGSRDPQWARPFERLAALVATKTGSIVRLAYLELMKPTLAEALADLRREGAKQIRIVPVFLASGGHIKQDLPRLVAAARERDPDLRVHIERPIGEQKDVLAAIAAVIAAK